MKFVLVIGALSVDEGSLFPCTCGGLFGLTALQPANSLSLTCSRCAPLHVGEESCMGCVVTAGESNCHKDKRWFEFIFYVFKKVLISLLSTLRSES